MIIAIFLCFSVALFALFSLLSICQHWTEIGLGLRMGLWPILVELLLYVPRNAVPRPHRRLCLRSGPCGTDLPICH